jgi:SAM-dependent methyltransferase
MRWDDSAPTRELMLLLPRYKLPGQSLWRAFELRAVRTLAAHGVFQPPILEIGCGDGGFSQLVLGAVDDAIDVNPRVIDRVRRSPNSYGQLHLMDARAMTFADGSYRTVFANCVLEHIPDVDVVLSNTFRVLARGGRLIATVPLREMNNHLVLKSGWYAALRRRQLCHVNLLSGDEWVSKLERAGYVHIEFYSYMDGRACNLWDHLDSPFCVGSGRYTLSAVTRLLGKALPRPVKRRLRTEVCRRICQRLDQAASDQAGPCAVAFVAHKVA